jgi:hypothetical protein
MTRYPLRAQIAKAGPATAVLLRQVADLVASKTGVTVNVSTRVGGRQEVIFVSEYADFAAFEKAQAGLLGDPDDNKRLESLQAEGPFLPRSVDTAFWLPI